MKKKTQVGQKELNKYTALNRKKSPGILMLKSRPVLKEIQTLKKGLTKMRQGRGSAGQDPMQRRF